MPGQPALDIDLLAIEPDPVAQQDVVDLAFLRQLREVELVERLDPAVGKAALGVEPLSDIGTV